MDQTTIVKQAGVIPWRIKNDKLEVLLITSRNGKRWVIPKGMLEPDMKKHELAALEAWEEAGLRGEVLTDAIGSYSYRKNGFLCKVKVYLMKVYEQLEDFPEASQRELQWLPPKKAAKLVNNEELAILFRNVSIALMREPGSNEK